MHPKQVFGWCATWLCAILLIERWRLIILIGKQMIPEHRIPTHPGEILLEEFLKPMQLSQVMFAQHIDVPTQRINEIVKGKRGITPAAAWLFAQAFGTTPEFWMNLQSHHDLAKRRPLRQIVPLQSTFALP